MKRVLCLFVIFALLFVMCSSIIAEGNVRAINLESKTGSAGKEVTLAIKVTNNEQGLASTKLKVKFCEALTLTGVTYNVATTASEQGVGLMSLDVAATDYFPRTSDAIINWVTLKNITGDFTMATLTFKIADDAPEGKYDIAFEYDEDDIYKVDGSVETNVPFTITGGAIEVKNYEVGDINSDGEIDGLDVTLLCQYLAEWDVVINESAADTNGDGEIDGLDVTLLCQYLAEWDVTLGGK
jgi:hypothetical protein